MVHDFIDAIDCNFPYFNKRLGKYLVLHACNDLRDEDVLHIIYEILYPGKNHQVDGEMKMYYIDLINEFWKNTSKDGIISLSKRKIMKNDFLEEEALSLLSKASSHIMIAIVEGLYVNYSQKIEEFADKIRGKLEN